jgi:hypothetical protein
MISPAQVAELRDRALDRESARHEHDNLRSGGVNFLPGNLAGGLTSTA